jgi:hypothetical protein
MGISGNDKLTGSSANNLPGQCSRGAISVKLMAFYLCCLLYFIKGAFKVIAGWVTRRQLLYSICMHANFKCTLYKSAKLKAAAIVLFC